MRHVSASVFLIVIILLIIIPPATEAGSGKIHGKITDAETSEPIAGASVVLVGTKLGAMTNADGEFGIVGIDAGTYVMRLSHIDYKADSITSLVVGNDATTEVSHRLNRTTTELDAEIVVVGKVDRLGPWRSPKHEVIISKKDIQNQPVKTVEEMQEDTSVVVTNAHGEIFVRGGRAGEVAYVVDGAPLSGGTAGFRQDIEEKPPAIPSCLSGTALGRPGSNVLQGVSIIIVGTNYRTVTNAYGNFIIRDIPDGRYEVVASCTGYKTRKLRNVLVESVKGTRIPVTLEQIEPASDKK